MLMLCYFLSVSTLVTLAGYEDDGEEPPSFADLLRDQIKTLRKQLNKTEGDDARVSGSLGGRDTARVPEQQSPPVSGFSYRRWNGATRETESRAHMPGEMPAPSAGIDGRRDMRATALAAASMKRAYFF